MNLLRENFIENFAVGAARIGKSAEKDVYLLGEWFFFRNVRYDGN